MCRFDKTYGSLLGIYWANSDLVRKALHIRKGSLGEWKRCRTDLYDKDIHSSFPYHVNLSKKGYRSLIYNCDHDLIGQVAGYTRTYSNRMTFATVKGGGHTAPQFNPKQCFAMFDRWISENPL
ncbi:Serine carboxypeptidase [Quillaja saponaria]|uniref:Serine carboxypeptidase n=1 Tax=Quillaja saponaria TaxID=32244 RepID=A0AAD7PSP3_QUISA|nr:Serine carboxypeptidase [Quillaja saponaria]